MFLPPALHLPKEKGPAEPASRSKEGKGRNLGSKEGLD